MENHANNYIYLIKKILCKIWNSIKSGGGTYNDKGMKNGKWVVLQDNFNELSIFNLY